MSYCRWSSDNFKSAVYVYESDQGWVTHVAGQMVVGDPPFGEYMDVIGTMDPGEWTRRYNEREAWFSNAKRMNIGLPHDGETFYDATPQACAERLVMLKGLGYHVPDGVIETLREEVD